ncbi:MAG: DUF4390 domain-containing protein [Thermodesulfovibrionales bacterium]
MKEIALSSRKQAYISKNGVRKPLNIFSCLAITLYFLISFNVQGAEGVELGTISVEIKEDAILVSSDLQLDEDQIEDLQNGIDKEITFYIDLFREWAVWPDEFISGTIINRKIKSDPVKKEFSMNSSGKTSDTEQRFNSLASLLSEALMLKDVELSSVGYLRPGRYFVKVSAESRIRKLAPIVGYLLFFVPEMNFKVDKNSDIFMIPEK